MPIVFGRSLVSWIISIVAAVLAFMLIKWLLPLLFNALHFPVPDAIVTVLAILVALLILFGQQLFPTTKVVG